MSSILGIHYCLPPTRLVNDDLVPRYGAEYVARMEAMTGIKERRVAGNTSDMAYYASAYLLSSLNIPRKDVAAVLFITESGEYSIPGNANILHARLGLHHRALIMDISMGCPGFVNGLILADSLASDGHDPVLLVNADAITRFVNPKTASLAFMHGDAAAATIVSRKKGLCLEEMEVKSNSDQWNTITLPNEQGQRYVSMKGVPVGHYVANVVPQRIREFADTHCVNLNTLGAILLHQANKYLVDMIYSALNVRDEQRFYFLKTVGNLSNASTPVLLAEAWLDGRILPRKHTLVTAYGAGLSCASALVYCDGPVSPVVGPVEQTTLEAMF